MVLKGLYNVHLELKNTERIKIILTSDFGVLWSQIGFFKIKYRLNISVWNTNT